MLFMNLVEDFKDNELLYFYDISKQPNIISPIVGSAVSFSISIFSPLFKSMNHILKHIIKDIFNKIYQTQWNNISTY